ncbi:hypothetical protein [Fibrobacter sp.]
MIKIIIILFFFFACSVMGADWIFEESPKEMMRQKITMKKDVFEMFFRDSLNNWERDGIYLFVEDKERLRLFFINGREVKFFQHPIMNKSRWINPDEYLEERKRKVRQISFDRCFRRMVLDEDAASFLKNTPFERFPLITVKKDWERLSKTDDVIYFGFVKEGDSISEFFFNDFRKNEIVIKKPLDRLVPLYDVLKKYPFNVYLEKCR